MNLKKITLGSILTVLLVIFVVAYHYSPRVKSWVVMGMMMLGFFKPDIPKPRRERSPCPGDAGTGYQWQGN